MFNVSPMTMLGLLGLCSLLCQLLAWRLKVPSILFLLLSGIILGPVTHIIKPDELFGISLNPMISIAVAIILFEGGLNLKLRELTNLKTILLRLIFVGGIINVLLMTLVFKVIGRFEWNIAFLLGSILIVTGPTVIKPLLQAVRPEKSIANLLKWEGILLDPLSGLLAVIVFSLIITGVSGHATLPTASYEFFKVVGVGAVMGFANAFLMRWVLKRSWLPNALMNFLVLNWVVLIYLISNFIADEAGLITVTLMAIVLANQRTLNIEPLNDFKESLTILLLSGLFIVLAARISFDSSPIVFVQAFFIFVFMQFVIQPLKTFIALAFTKFTWQQKLLISWIAPRGIIAAALISLFAIQLPLSETTQHLTNLVFYILLFNIVFICLTAKPLAKTLRLSLPTTKSVLIIGANPLAREIGIALKEQGIETLLVDSNWKNISAARLKDLPTYFGNPISDDAEHKLDPNEMGMMLALTPSSEFNTLIGMRYYHIFGSSRIFYIKIASIRKTAKRHQVAEKHRGSPLFGESITFKKIAHLLEQGAEIKCVKLSESFDKTSFLEHNDHQVIPLFVLSSKGDLIPVLNEKFQASTGDAIIYLSAGKESNIKNS